MHDAEAPFDHVVLGAGGTGLLAGLRLQNDHPGLRLAVVEARPRPGGDWQTQRSNGFVCELGPFALPRTLVDAFARLLPRAPQPIEALPAAGAAHADVATRPVTFRTGIEELPQACRQQLGARLRLGRAAVSLHPAEGGATGAGWTIGLGGEVPHTIVAHEVTLALPLAAASALLAPLDPALAAVAARLADEPRAFVFLGGEREPADDGHGHGFVAAADEPGPLVDAIACTSVFAGRALPGRSLWRCEAAGPRLMDDDQTLLAAVQAQLRARIARRADFGFTKVHRFREPVVDGAHAECRARIAGLAGRAVGLHVG
jgi:protoporphyrinogen oxidase